MSDQHKPQPTLSEAEQTELHQSMTANAGPPPGTTPPAPYPVFNAKLPNGPFPASKMVNDVSDLMFLTARSLGKTDPLPVLQMLCGKSRGFDYPKSTPPEKQKLRNSCLSGHSGEAEREVCQYCQKARFYSLTTGYHSDMPTTAQVETYLIGEGWRERDQDTYAFALRYLGVGDINLDNTWVQERFIAKLRALDYLLGYMSSGSATHWALHPVSREYRPLPNLVSGKSAFMASIVRRDDLLTEIYAQATTHNLEGVFDIERYADMYRGKKYGHSQAMIQALLGGDYDPRHTVNPVSIRNMTQAEVAEDLAKPKPKPSSLMQGLLKRLDR